MPVTAPELVPAARRELKAWQRNGADLLADGQVTRGELDRAIAAWAAMVELFEMGRADTDLTFDQLLTVVAANLMRRREAIDANQDPERHPALEQRAADVASIWSRIRRNRYAAPIAEQLAA